jgi:hypothetical protein
MCEILGMLDPVHLLGDSAMGYPQTRMEDGLQKFVAWYRGGRAQGLRETA